MMKFDLPRATGPHGPAARVGRLQLAGRAALDTPNFLANTSRGAIPHVTPDLVAQHMRIGGVYLALEDFYEKKEEEKKKTKKNVGEAGVIPILQTPPTPLHARPLHAFTATPPCLVTVLGPRRFPPVATPVGNTQDDMAIFTARGYQPLKVTDYRDAVRALRPDIAVPPADLSNASFSTKTLQSKRTTRMVDRTDEWTKAWLDDDDDDDDDDNGRVATFAPVLPIGYSLQCEYLDRLATDYAPAAHDPSRRASLAGLALYDADVLPHLQDAHPNLTLLPRLALGAPASPHDVLRQVALGLDLFLLPFLNSVSDGGVALTFTFPPPPPPPPPAAGGRTLLPLGIDMSSPAHSRDPGPLLPGCACYACTAHHRAYVHHLLHAREMLGWTLLQLHNHTLAAAFFAGIRAALLAGGDSAAGFEAARARFAAAYEPDLPVGTGERPRARGYHFKSEPGDGKRNHRPWGRMGDRMGEGRSQNSQVETPLRPDDEGTQELGVASGSSNHRAL
ncbi:hypothetical protein P8C59_007956 [Phyllachora maydis]|uniref:Queuine tRNA-ribosyltransferase accessory subunit 2 n=1 Tax=Phyllachora maydis TaxID=1825666 RepID=A0AAD9MHN3_9PEZI|nr:hypothetical protein P8C59_007956 [Phyllachora maydis]